MWLLWVTLFSGGIQRVTRSAWVTVMSLYTFGYWQADADGSLPAVFQPGGNKVIRQV